MRGRPEGRTVCSRLHYPRKVAHDATISWDGGPLALPRRRDGRSWAGRVVTLEEHLDSSLWVTHEGVCYPLAPAPLEWHGSRHPDYDVHLTIAGMCA